MKLLKFISGNILFLLTLFLISFIPLYPKLPIIDIQNTWVYIRLEDFAVLTTLLVWFWLFLKKKVNLKTPLTFPIIIYWLIGAVSTLHGVMILFPLLSNVFSNVALLSMFRRIEYMSLFFVAYWAIKDKGEKYVLVVIVTLIATLIGVVGYGFGQHYLGFPAYLTMNEEFAKGVPIQLSALSRVPSTFAGHYDLAAYLVLIIPIVVSLAFGFKNLFIKLFLFATAAVSFGLLFLTVSRVSFFVLMVSLFFLLIIQKKKWLLISIIIFTGLFLASSPRLLQRFQSTVSKVDILVDARTGNPINKVKEVPRSYFKDKIVVQQSLDAKVATGSSTIVPYEKLPETAELIIEPNAPNGENLPQGTSYINLTLSPVVRSTKYYFYEKAQTTTNGAVVQEFIGDYVVKNARAYDLSFTTRFQGEWPRALLAFERNLLLGSGFGSVSLAVDNDFLRILGETGLLGFLSFVSIFTVAAIYIVKILPKINSPVIRSLVLGFVAGTIGLLLNAVLIDVFEASKIAFFYWMLMGIILGILSSYKDFAIDITREFGKILTSNYAAIIGLLALVLILFSSSSDYYFVGDDFTWLRWVIDCRDCSSFSNIVNYFTQSNGFFYRPGTKLYFDFMYPFFWLNQGSYHFASIILHFMAAALIFFISKKILKDFYVSLSVAIAFVILSGYAEAVFWISSTGFLFNAVFALGALLSFIYWKEKGKNVFIILSVILSFISMFFHEVGVVVPLILISFDIAFYGISFGKIKNKAFYLLLLLPELPYFFLRITSSSHWFNGDYSYNLLKLPFNFFGNILGYLSLSVLGTFSLPLYESLRNILRSHLTLSIIPILIILLIMIWVYKKRFIQIEENERKIITFAALFFVVSLLPFLGLGNISSRYAYLPTFAVALILVLLTRRLYLYLLSNGKQLAIMITLLIVVLFSSLHLFQFQSYSGDWYNAGIRVKNILTSLEYIYAHYSEITKDFYFVNVPIKQGGAWVFPVGLSDAAWIDIRDNDLNIYQVPTVEEAFSLNGNNDGRVFVFDDRGYFTEMIKTSTGEIVPFMQSPVLESIKK